jgi:hypothetical protein
MKSNFSTLRTNSDNSHGLTNSGLETVEKRTTSDNPHGINKFWIGNSGKFGEVDITTKVKRGDYFNSPQDFIHKFQNKP